MVILYLGGPVLYGALFGFVYTKGKFDDLPIVVVDQDGSPVTRQMIDMLDESDLLTVKEIRYTDFDVEKTFLGDKAYAVLIIPYHFESDMLLGRQPEINCYINNSNMMPAGHTNRGITGVLNTLNSMKTIAMGKKPEAFHLNTFRLFNPSSNYFLYIWPSYLGIIMQSIAMVVLALSIASEFEKKSLKELYHVAGNSMFRLALSKLVVYWLLGLFALTVFTLYFLLFRQPFPEHVTAVLGIAFLFVVTSTLVGMAAGLLFRSQLKSLQCLMVVSMPVYISSGYSWPSDQSSEFARIFANAFPYTPFVDGFKVLLTEHGSLTDITHSLSMQSIQLLFYMIVVGLLLKWRLKKWNQQNKITSINPYTILPAKNKNYEK
jgi:ABC-2 type transport system permease protein